MLASEQAIAAWCWRWTWFATGVADVAAKHAAEAVFEEQPCTTVVRLFLAEDYFGVFAETFGDVEDLLLGPWIQLLDTDDAGFLCIGVVAGVACSQQLVANFTRTEDDFAGTFGSDRWVGQDFLKRPSTNSLIGLAASFDRK